jgi:hypothetical protein
MELILKPWYCKLLTIKHIAFECAEADGGTHRVLLRVIVNVGMLEHARRTRIRHAAIDIYASVRNPHFHDLRELMDEPRCQRQLASNLRQLL